MVAVAGVPRRVGAVTAGVAVGGVRTVTAGGPASGSSPDGQSSGSSTTNDGRLLQPVLALAGSFGLKPLLFRTVGQGLLAAEFSFGLQLGLSHPLGFRQGVLLVVVAHEVDDVGVFRQGHHPGLVLELADAGIAQGPQVIGVADVPHGIPDAIGVADHAGATSTFQIHPVGHGLLEAPPLLLVSDFVLTSRSPPRLPRSPLRFPGILLPGVLQ